MPDFCVFSSVLKKLDILCVCQKQSRQQMKRMMPELSKQFCLFYNIVDVEEIKRKAMEYSIAKKKNK